MTTGERLPYEPPRWLTPRRVVLGAFVSSPVASIVEEVVRLARSVAAGDEVRFARIALHVGAFFVVLALGAWFERAKTTKALWRRYSVFGLPIIGLLLLGVLWTLSAGSHRMEVVAVLAWWLLCLGWTRLLFSRTLAARSMTPAHDAGLQTLCLASLWTAVNAVGPVLLTPVFGTSLASAISAGDATFVTAALVIFAASSTALAARRRWLARVRRGEEARWRVIAEDEAGAQRQVLVRVEAPEDPYREAERVVPVATLSSR